MLEDAKLTLTPQTSSQRVSIDPTPNVGVLDVNNDADNVGDASVSRSASQEALQASGEVQPMKLLPPPTSTIYSTLDEGEQAVRQWAASQGYRISVERSNPGSQRNQPRRWLQCDRGGKTRIIIKEENRQRDGHNLKKTDCKFAYILSSIKALDSRVKLQLINKTHNHLPLPISVLPAARVALLKQHTKYILDKLAAGAYPRQFINRLLQKNPNMRVTAALTTAPKG